MDMDMQKHDELIEHDLVQGTPEWHAFRLEHDGASEAAAMLGLSKKVKRSELLHAKHTGIAREFSDWVQENVLDRGHEVEAMARPIVAKQRGIRLFPMVYSRGRLSASCDGITMLVDTGWEHKQKNAELFAAVAAGELPDEYMPQPQQCMMVTGAERWIFTVSDGTEENMVSMEVLPDPVWFERIRAGWIQFRKDLAEYVPPNIVEMPKAEVTIELPALFVHAKGEITEHNMDAFGVALTAKLSEVRAIALVTDQDFSNAKEAAKKFRATAKTIALSKEAMLAQTETIGEAARKMDAWAKDLNTTALQLEKDVEREDLAKKQTMILEAKQAYADHIAALEGEIKPIRLMLTPPNFADAIKGKSKYSSMHDAIQTMLSIEGKQKADEQAKDIRAKLAWCKENAAGHSALFPDLQALMAKPLEDFVLTISSRIEKQKADEAERLEAERVRMQAEEEAKARAKVEAEIKEEQATLKQYEKTENLGEEISPIVRVTDAAQHAQIDTGNTINLGEINKRLGFMVTADFLATLGFEARQEKNAKLYRECDFLPICNALMKHIHQVAGVIIAQMMREAA